MKKNISNKNIISTGEKAPTERLQSLMQCLENGEAEARKLNYCYMDGLSDLQTKVETELKKLGLLDLSAEEIGCFPPYGNIISKLYNNCLDQLIIDLLKKHPSAIFSPFNTDLSVRDFSQYSNLLDAISYDNEKKIWLAILPQCVGYITLAHITPLLNNINAIKFFIENLPIINIALAESELHPIDLSIGDLCYQLYTDNIIIDEDSEVTALQHLIDILNNNPLHLFAIFKNFQNSRSLLETIIYKNDRNLWSKVKKNALSLIQPKDILGILDNHELLVDDFLFDIFQDIELIKTDFNWNELICYNNDQLTAPISLAALYGHDKIFDFLLRKGADLTVRMPNNSTVLDNALTGVALKYLRSNDELICLSHYNLTKNACIDRKKQSYLKIIKIVYDNIQKNLRPNTADTAYDFHAYSRWGSPFFSAISSLDENIVLKTHLMTQSCLKNNIHFSYDINTITIKNGTAVSPFQWAIHQYQYAINDYLKNRRGTLVFSGESMIKTLIKNLKPNLLSDYSAGQDKIIYKLESLPPEIVTLYAEKLKEQLQTQPAEMKAEFFAPIEPRAIPYKINSSDIPESVKKFWKKEVVAVAGKTPVHEAVDCGNEVLFQTLAEDWPLGLECSSFLGNTPVTYACLKALDNKIPMSFFENIIECCKVKNARFWLPITKAYNPYPNILESSETSLSSLALAHRNYLQKFHDGYASFIENVYTNPFLIGATVLDLAFYWRNFNMLESLLLNHNTLQGLATESQAVSPLLFLCKVENRTQSNQESSHQKQSTSRERFDNAMHLYRKVLAKNPALIDFFLGMDQGKSSALDHCLSNKCFMVFESLIEAFLPIIITKLTLEHIKILLEKTAECLVKNNIAEAKTFIGYVNSWCQAHILMKKPLIDITNSSFYTSLSQIFTHHKKLRESVSLDSYFEVYLSHIQKSLSYDNAARLNLHFLLQLFLDHPRAESADFIKKLIEKGFFRSMPLQQLSALLHDTEIFCEKDQALLAAAVLTHAAPQQTRFEVLSFYIRQQQKALSYAIMHKTINPQELHHLLKEIAIADLSENELEILKDFVTLLPKEKKSGKKNKISPYAKITHYLNQQLKNILELSASIKKEASFAECAKNIEASDKKLDIILISEPSEPRAEISENPIIDETTSQVCVTSELIVPSSDVLLENPSISPEKQVENEPEPIILKKKTRHVTVSPILCTFYEVPRHKNSAQLCRSIETNFAKKSIAHAISSWNNLSDSDKEMLPSTTNAILAILAAQNPKDNAYLGVESIAFIVFSVSKNKVDHIVLHRVLSALSKEQLSAPSIALLHLLRKIIDELMTREGTNTKDLLSVISCLDDLLKPLVIKAETLCAQPIAIKKKTDPAAEIEALITPTSSQVLPLLLNRRFEDALYCWERLPQFSRDYSYKRTKTVMELVQKGEHENAETLLRKCERRNRAAKKKALLYSAERFNAEGADFKKQAAIFLRKSKECYDRAATIHQFLHSSMAPIRVLQNPVRVIEGVRKPRGNNTNS